MIRPLNPHASAHRWACSRGPQGADGAGKLASLGLMYYTGRYYNARTTRWPALRAAEAIIARGFEILKTTLSPYRCGWMRLGRIRFYKHTNTVDNHNKWLNKTTCSQSAATPNGYYNDELCNVENCHFHIFLIYAMATVCHPTTFRFVFFSLNRVFFASMRIDFIYNTTTQIGLHLKLTFVLPFAKRIQLNSNISII